MKLNAWFLAVLVSMLLLIVGCSGGEKGTLASLDVDLSNGMESEIPIPDEASIKTSMEEDGVDIIMFNPGGSFREAEDFYIKELPERGWDVTSETIETDEEGEVESYWTAEKDGKTLNVTVSGFGGKDSEQMISGVISLR